ncbi:MAG: hypothetical protein K9J16_05020 [Melioribacteraceae bacterium]|nr:hypothetical protein [Melioribacteraceae bacterium]MCF8354206.1 hypothetical protein [Melioribacteraceae bacterium]MCF8392852.1 hypothetical protein [Melioribacteraceae bacterium]MCF8418662.1 hypothetical protein [Melioribacteraceae bacterium]
MKNFFVWFLAFIITASSAVYQRLTGPTYPISGEQTVLNQKIEYKFLTSMGGDDDADVRVTVPDNNIEGKLFWKRYKTSDDWTIQNMERDGDTLFTALPNQPPAGKLRYYVELTSAGQNLKLPPGDDVVIRFKGEVPTLILILHVIAMFGSMLLSTRTGLEFFRKEPKLKNLTLWTIGFLLAGGFILGPIVQKYAFDAYWTGFPFGYDLTDNKTLIALVGWLIAYFMYKRSEKPKNWALFASILLLLIFMIPHSVMGSELDYEKLDKEKSKTEIQLEE